jgi:S1-C subfamily serine protease
MNKIKISFFILSVLVLGALGGIVGNRYLFPYLSTTKLFSKYDFLKKTTEEVTFINKTEQVFVKEETSIGKISNQVASSVVNILSSTPKPASFKNGTGLIVTGDGLVMTYAEAILPNAKYKVVTQDGGVFEAEFLGTDSYSNLSFLKINATNLPSIALGNSDDSNPGEKVIAIGNSSEIFANRYSAGLLSTFSPTFNLSGKAFSYSEKMDGVFQTDFSTDAEEFYVGGPVVDYTGQAIGVIGSLEKNGKKEFFFIPANKAKKVIEKAIRKEISQNVALGIYYIPLTRAYALSNNLKTENGALIFSSFGQEGLAILSGSAAQKAGFRLNDIILAVGGEQITQKIGLPDLLYQYKKGDKVEFTVLRNAQEIRIEVQF